MKPYKDTLPLILSMTLFAILSGILAIHAILNVMVNPFAFIIGAGMSFLCYKAYRHFHNIYNNENGYGN